MLYANRTLILTRTASCTLPEHLFRYVRIRVDRSFDRNFGARFGDDRNRPFGTVVAQIRAHSENYFFWVEQFSGIIRRAVLRAAAALDAAERLQRHDVCNILSGFDSEILIAFERRDITEASAFQKDRYRTEYEVKMLGVRNQGKENQGG